MIKTGTVRSAQTLLPYIFQFFLLVDDKESDLSQQRVLGLAAEVIRNRVLKSQETVSAFRPFINHFFVDHARSYRPVSGVRSCTATLLLSWFCF